MARNTFACGECGQMFFHNREIGRPPRYCNKCRNKIARIKTAERQRRWRRYHNQRYREERALMRIHQSIERIKKA